ncbi:4-phosphoerythronate dehydrogenase [Thalassotalea euphylliae]|uniref:Erythronate-4-phosphate dehydrogenase n=1 Tax=Thalassotalea euphylliae TaxID=1655234 RepID=A0A3E0TUN7_9GAMM|nr:4-phosphoerythronate dehydrogenase [Thalassotalea euphylliae]REL27635.1 4-phosphoerythronate dehydrogenase [Thalassotalea euphylliae]
MKIYFDENMPFAREFFNELGGEQHQLVPFKGRELSADDLVDADVLLVRSITKVNEALLCKAQQLTFVGTATIGVDHIDQTYLAKRGITFSSAPGCNAISVAEFVISSLVILAERYQLPLLDKTVGIVGAGNTGSRLSEKLIALGIRYKLCDPILAAAGDSRDFVTLEEALACDVVSLHVPLTRDGQYPTYHLLNSTRLSALSEQQILINACRGEVIDNQALLALKQQGHGVTLVMDVWEDEPDVLTDLIPYADLATAHIAGYSLEGKARGTEILYQALCQQMGLGDNKQLSDFLPAPTVACVQVNGVKAEQGISKNQKVDEILLNQLVKMVYDVRRDDGIFRQQLSRFGFDHIRKNYPVRREFSSLSVSGESSSLNTLVQLGFNGTKSKA